MTTRATTLENVCKPALIAMLIVLAACDDMLAPEALDYPAPRIQAFPDTVTVSQGTTVKIDVAVNDLGGGPGATIRLLSGPFVGKADTTGESIFYTAPPASPGFDLLLYELSGRGESSIAFVRVSISDLYDSADGAPADRVIWQAVELSDVPHLPFVPVDIEREDIRALVPLTNEILAAYGNPQGDLNRARAIRDWVARTAIHPYPPLHPDESSANLAVLPPGTSWTEVNHLPHDKVASDSRYWAEVHFDGYAMLDRLLGRLDRSSGVRAEDGLMERVGPGHWRVRDIEEYRYVLCSYQDVMAIALWGAIGLQGMLLSTVGHDPAAVFIPDLGKWVYQDPTYNEEFLLDGSDDVLSPLELVAYSLGGMKDRLGPQKLPGPRWSPDRYIDPAVDRRATYFGDGHPNGMTVMGTQLNNGSPDTPGFHVHLVQIRTPHLDAEWPFSNERWYTRVDPATAFPQLGARVREVRSGVGAVELTLASTFPGHRRFERKIGARSWEVVADQDLLARPATATHVLYRSLDAVGRAGMTAAFEVQPDTSQATAR